MREIYIKAVLMIPKTKSSGLSFFTSRHFPPRISILCSILLKSGTSLRLGSLSNVRISNHPRLCADSSSALLTASSLHRLTLRLVPSERLQVIQDDA